MVLFDTFIGNTKKDQTTNNSQISNSTQLSDNSVRTFTDARAFTDSRAYSSQYTYNPQITISSPNATTSSRSLPTIGNATTANPNVTPSVTSSPVNTLQPLQQNSAQTGADSSTWVLLGIGVVAILGIAYAAGNKTTTVSVPVKGKASVM